MKCLHFALVLLVGCGNGGDNLGTSVGNALTFIDAPLVRYSAEANLSNGPTPVMLNGLAGSLQPPGGLLHVAGPGDPFLAPISESGTFAVVVVAELNDTVQLTYETQDGQGSATIELATDLVPVGDGGPVPRLLTPLGDDDTVQISVAGANFVGLPLVLSNVTNGEVLYVESEVVNVGLPAANGHRLCAFSVAGGTSSLSVCEVVSPNS